MLSIRKKSSLITALLVITTIIFSGCDEVPEYNGNRPPTINEIKLTGNDPTVVNDSNIIVMEVDALDLDGDNLQYNYQLIDVSGIEIDPRFNNTTTGQSKIDLTVTGVISGKIKVTVRDGNGGMASRTFGLHDNAAPYIKAFVAKTSRTQSGETVPITIVVDNEVQELLLNMEHPGTSIGTIQNISADEKIYNADFVASNNNTGISIMRLTISNDYGEATSEFKMQTGDALKYERFLNAANYGSPYSIQAGDNGQLYVNMLSTPRYLVLDTLLNVLNDVTYSGVVSPRFMTVDESVNPPVFYTAPYDVQDPGVISTFNLADGSNVAGTDLPFSNQLLSHILIREDGSRLVSSDLSGHLFLIDNSDNITPWGTGNPPNESLIAPRQLAEHPGNNNIYVTLRSRNKIHIYDAAGNYITQLNSPIGFSSPHGVAIDAANELVYVGDTDNDMIQVFRTTDHQFVQAILVDVNSSPRYLAVGADGKLYVAVTGFHSIYVYEYGS